MRAVFAALLLGLLVGCGKSGPSYAELLTVYEAEQAELDRLIKEMEDGKQSAAVRAKYVDVSGGLEIAKSEAIDRGANQEEIAAIDAKLKRAEADFVKESEPFTAPVKAQRKRVEAAKAARDAARP